MPWSSLDGWPGDRPGAALAAFRMSCKAMLRGRARWPRKSRYGGTRKDWELLCRKGLKISGGRKLAVLRFWRDNFQPVEITARSSLFTGYFEPEIDGSRVRKSGYEVPLYLKPKDLVKARTKGGWARKTSNGTRPYYTRKQIEQGALKGRGLEFVWLRDPVDAFFLHIQGSGRIWLGNEETIRVGFAAKNGRPYTPVGRILIKRGAIARDKMSMQAIRAWLTLNPDKMRELFWRNQSFIFFREIPIRYPRLGPPGAQGVELTPLHSLAVDPRFVAYGTPLWLETRTPTGDGGALETFRRILVAQDTGTAIKGEVRGDIFFGSGGQAGYPAGLMQSPGRLILLLPKGLASRVAR
ncbi:MAG: MltA domain-containing protein [Pseudomonadota bacterium]